jgi:GTP-binding protein Era
LENTKSVFAAIVGRPNVGKSSILNSILGQKVAIVSAKPQTTRTKIMGVLTRGETQIVFTDTPGLHSPKNKLGDFMVRSIADSIGNVDICVLVADAGGKGVHKTELDLIEKFKTQDIPAILVLNKIDTLKSKQALADKIAEYSELLRFEAVVPTSAVKGEGVESLTEEICKLAGEGPHFFPDDTLTDQPERVIAAEIIREKLLKLLSDEVPHGIAVDIEKMRERENNQSLMDIEATIYCERDSHKGIIIGKSGALLKRVGTYAREDIEAFLECKVNLKLWVKVRDDWRNSERSLKNFGFNEEH